MVERRIADKERGVHDNDESGRSKMMAARYAAESDVVACSCSCSKAMETPAVRPATIVNRPWHALLDVRSMEEEGTDAEEYQLAAHQAEHWVLLSRTPKQPAVRLRSSASRCSRR